MKKKKLLVGLLCGTAAFGLAACDGESTTLGDGTYASVKDLVDTRAEIFETYEEDGTLDKTFKSFEMALEHVVNNMDYNAYVLKKGDTLDQKLFVADGPNSSNYGNSFWYYQNGSQLFANAPWDGLETVYTKETGTICYMYEDDSIKVWVNTAEAAKIAENTGVTSVGTPGTIAHWNTDPTYESYISVDAHPYSGATKNEYNISLSQAKIAPSLNDFDQTFANIGFVIADGYQNSRVGIGCDTTNGNWYYYSGEAGQVVYDTSKVVMESNWNTTGYWQPKSDISVSLEILGGDTGEVEDHLIVKTSSGTEIVNKKYTMPTASDAATIRLTCGLDIVREVGEDYGSVLQDVSNGSYFENLVITKGTSTILQDAIDGVIYGQQTAIKTAGEYDLLNSNPQSVVRFHTTVESAFATYDFSTAGKDIYSFSYAPQQDNATYGENVEDVVANMIAISLLDLTALTDENKTLISTTRTAYDALASKQRTVVTANLFSKFVAAEAAV